MITFYYLSGSLRPSGKNYLYQYDKGQKLYIQGLDLPPVVEVHFSLDPSKGNAIPRLGTSSDNILSVDIPDSLLINNDTDRDYYIYVFLCSATEQSRCTEHRISIHIIPRPKPVDYEIPEDPEVISLFDQVVEKVESAATRAEAAMLHQIGGAENIGKLLYVDDRGKVSVVELGEGLKLERGVLSCTNVVPVTTTKTVLGSARLGSTRLS